MSFNPLKNKDPLFPDINLTHLFTDRKMYGGFKWSIHCTCREKYSSLHTKNKNLLLCYCTKETTLILKIEMLKCIFHNKML